MLWSDSFTGHGADVRKSSVGKNWKPRRVKKNFLTQNCKNFGSNFWESKKERKFIFLRSID